MRVGLWRKLSTKELMLLNCGLEKTPESPLDCKEIQPVHPKEISPKYSLKGLMIKLKLQYFGHLMQRTNSLEKILMVEEGEGGRRKDDRGWESWMASPTRWTQVWRSSGDREGQGSLCVPSTGHDELDTTERLKANVSRAARVRRSCVPERHWSPNPRSCRDFTWEWGLCRWSS